MALPEGLSLDRSTNHRSGFDTLASRVKKTIDFIERPR
jgi:hypothetical protein